MAERAADVKAWLNAIDDDSMIAVDSGGLTLVAYDPETKGDDLVLIDEIPERHADSYYELGGVPLPDDDEADA